MSAKCRVLSAKSCVLLLGALVVVAFAVNGQSKQEADLAVAKKNFEADRSEENYIWYGRRTAYTGDFEKAIEIYTDALKKYPNSYRLLRHRGHRYISTRKFDLAISDLMKGEQLMKGKPLEVEQDGIPNKLNKPLSTTQFNVFYHLALAHYLKADFAKAEETWRKCLAVCENDDSKVAVLDWLYMTLRREAKHDEAKKLLDEVNNNMEIIENGAYYVRLKFYKDPGGWTVFPPYSDASIWYGIANYYYYTGKVETAKEIFTKMVAEDQTSSFGYIAAEADLARMK